MTMTARSSKPGAGPIGADQVRVAPANEVPWADLAAVFGSTGYPGACLCQRYKVPGCFWRDSTRAQRAGMLQVQAACDDPAAEATSGLVAYVDGIPAGWVAVEPRIAYPKLRTTQIPWRGRAEDKDDESVWAVTCFCIRTGFRGRGLMYHLAAATTGFARDCGARALEAYPMITQPGQQITWGEAHVGVRQVFADTGFREISHPTPRRVVMRLEFGC